MNRQPNCVWKVRQVGACGDLIREWKDGEIQTFGSMLYLEALELARLLNQRERWLFAD